jgi:soluble lytic murein transglycosylase-like protein
MATTTTISVPKSGLTSPSSWGSREQVKEQLDNIMKKYGTFIKFASENSKIPAQVIASFIAVESGGNPTAGGSGSATQGLMQWNRTYAKNFLEAEYRLGRLTPAEKSKLATYGVKFDANGLTRTITQADAIKPELNILIGSILLGQYADSRYDGGKLTGQWAIDQDGKLRLDRIITVYNAGAYGPDGKKARTGNHPTAFALANVVNSTTKSYINKILGKNGAMDIAMNEVLPDIAAL